MADQSVSALPLAEEICLLRKRIASLEAENLRLSHRFEQGGREQSGVGQADSGLHSKEVFDHISVCMFLVDVTSDSRFRYAGFNAAEERAVGLSTADVAGKFVEEVFEERLARKLIGNYRRCLEEGTPISYEDELDLPGGRRYFHSNLIPIRNDAGRIYRIVGACTDMTDLKRAQEEAVARQKLEGIGLLAAGIAHDFNNLLGSILTESELAESEMADGLSPAREIETIKFVASRAGEIVRELMVYAGEDEHSLEPVDLSVVVKEMLELLKISISKNATLEFELPKSLPAVRANPAQIQQVILNLVTNASEAIGDTAGTISVSIKEARSDAGPAGNGSLADRGVLRLTVSDTGVGMTNEVRARIFDPFYTTKFAGRGLGLSAVQGIVRSHGGSIEVTSAPGRGSSFEILLPCATELVERRPEPNSQHAAGDMTRTVLLVEDEAILRSALSTLLRKQQFEVIEAADGISGLQLFSLNKDRIDVVFLDMTLPGMGGRDVMREVHRIRPGAKVVLTSAYSEDCIDPRDDSKPLDFIRKPYSIRSVVTALRQACDNARAGRTIGSFADRVNARPDSR